MYSLVGFFLSKKKDYKKTTKAFSRMQYTSFRMQPKEKDTLFPKEQFVQQLQDNGNLFVHAPFKIITKGIFLPPKSKTE